MEKEGGQIGRMFVYRIVEDKIKVGKDIGLERVKMWNVG